MVQTHPTPATGRWRRIWGHLAICMLGAVAGAIATAVFTVYLPAQASGRLPQGALDIPAEFDRCLPVKGKISELPEGNRGAVFVQDSGGQVTFLGMTASNGEFTLPRQNIGADTENELSLDFTFVLISMPAGWADFFASNPAQKNIPTDNVLYRHLAYRGGSQDKC
jgi:hypothetical protein